MSADQPDTNPGGPAVASSQRLLWILVGLLAVLVVVMAVALGLLLGRGKQPGASSSVAQAAPTTTAMSPSPLPPGPTQTPVVVVTVVEVIITATPQPATQTSLAPTATTVLPTVTPTVPTATATATATPSATLLPTPTPTRPALALRTPPITTTVSLEAVSAPSATGPAPQPSEIASELTGHIVFAQLNNGEPDIMAVDVATSQTWKVHTWGSQPRLRADGRVLFNGIGGGKNNLVSVLLDGSHELITTLHPEDAYPDWSPSGESSVFDSTFLQWHNQTIFVQPDITKVQEPPPLQVRGQDALGRAPTWLKNGRIAFTGCDYWSTGSRCGLWSVNSDGSGQPIRLSEQPNDRSTDSIEGQVLYASASSGNWEIYAVPDNGGTARNLSNNPSQDFGAAFSPDGRHIAFASNRDGGWGIWIMNADGSNPRKLIPVPGGFGPNWQEERLSWGS